MEHKTTLEAYSAWEASLPEGLRRELPATVMQGYQRAAAATELRLASETALGSGHASDADLLAAYLAYVKLEQAGAWLFRLYGRGPGVVTTKTQPNPSLRTGLLCSSLLTRQQHWLRTWGLSAESVPSHVGHESYSVPAHPRACRTVYGYTLAVLVMLTRGWLHTRGTSGDN